MPVLSLRPRRSRKLVRNRRRGAPRAALIRRIAAIALLLCAGALVVRDHRAAVTPVAAQTAETPSPDDRVIPIVLSVADTASTRVLHEGDRVDVWASYGDEPPTLVATGLPLLEVHQPDEDVLTQASAAHIVVGITPSHEGLIPELLAGTIIAATVSAVHQ